MYVGPADPFLHLPWGAQRMSQVCTTPRSLKYLRYSLDQWSEGNSDYLLRLLGLLSYYRSRRFSRGKRGRRTHQASQEMLQNR